MNGKYKANYKEMTHERFLTSGIYHQCPQLLTQEGIDYLKNIENGKVGANTKKVTDNFLQHNNNNSSDKNKNNNNNNNNNK